MGVAATVGGWSVRHRLVAIVGWVLFVGLAMAVGSAAGQQHMSEDEYAKGDSARALQILDAIGCPLPP